MNEIHDTVGAYVLDALEPDELTEFEAHLAECAACRAEVHELRSVVDVLPLLTEPVEPPSHLRDDILRQVRGEDEQPEGLRLVEGGAPRRARRWGMVETLLATAAAIAIVALGSWNLVLQQRHNNQPPAALAPVVAALTHGARVAPISGTGTGSAAGAAMVQPRRGPAYFVVDGLKPAPSRKVYQLWLVKTGKAPRSAGVFSISGTGPQVIRLPVSTAGYPVAAVTVEPGPRGSRAPTGAKVLAGSLSA